MIENRRAECLYVREVVEVSTFVGTGATRGGCQFFQAPMVHKDPVLPLLRCTTLRHVYLNVIIPVTLLNQRHVSKVGTYVVPICVPVQCPLGDVIIIFRPRGRVRFV